MTDEAKALVAWLREEADFAHYRAEEDMLTEAADTVQSIAAQLAEALAESERLRGALRGVFEEWAGSEGFIPETAPEGYLLHLTKRMADIARAALAGG